MGILETMQYAVFYRLLVLFILVAIVCSSFYLQALSAASDNTDVIHHMLYVVKYLLQHGFKFLYFSQFSRINNTGIPYLFCLFVCFCMYFLHLYSFLL